MANPGESSLSSQATGSRLGTLVETFIGMLFALVVAFVYSWLMTLMILAVVPILIVAGVLQIKALTGHATSNKKALEHAGKVSYVLGVKRVLGNISPLNSSRLLLTRLRTPALWLHLVWRRISFSSTRAVSKGLTGNPQSYHQADVVWKQDCCDCTYVADSLSVSIIP